MASYIDVVFDGPPAAKSGRFVEVEDETGASISAGEWIEREDGYWALRIATSKAEPEAEDDRQAVTVVFEPGSIVVVGSTPDPVEIAQQIVESMRTS